MKPFVAEKSGSGWKLFLYRDRLRGYANARLIEKFDRKSSVPPDNILAITERSEKGKAKKQLGFEPAANATVFRTKSAASSAAHLIGRYMFGFGDMVFTYLEFREPGRTGGRRRPGRASGKAFPGGASAYTARARAGHDPYYSLQLETARRRDPGMFHSDVGYHIERITGGHRDDVIALINRDSIAREIERLRIRGEDSLTVAERFAKLLVEPPMRYRGGAGFARGRVSGKHLDADERDFAGIERDARDIGKRVKGLRKRDASARRATAKKGRRPGHA